LCLFLQVDYVTFGCHSWNALKGLVTHWFDSFSVLVVGF
jgi:hypothetical protein